MFWTVSTICVESWIEEFNKNTKRDDFDACSHYEILSQAFSPFFFLFYLILQLLSIIQTFLGIAKFIHQENSTDLTVYLLFCGYAVTLGLKENY